MPGLGRRTFNAGEVLTAANVQGYLQDQAVMVFGGTAARSSAIPTPTTGMTTYNQASGQLETYNGSAYVGMSGLQLVKKQTIESAVSSVSVTDAFSATYENYQIIVSGGVASGYSDLTIQLTGITTGYYWSGRYSSYGSTTPQAASALNTSSFFVGSGTPDTNHVNCYIQNPFATKAKKMTANFDNLLASGASGELQGFNLSTTSATAFTITPSAGTLTGGTIYVYGYGQ